VSAFSRDWPPKAARLASLGWKMKHRFFQTLENLVEIFPSLGKIRAQL
jgi:hypothetical protein